MPYWTPTRQSLRGAGEKTSERLKRTTPAEWIFTGAWKSRFRGGLTHARCPQVAGPELFDPPVGPVQTSPKLARGVGLSLVPVLIDLPRGLTHTIGVD